jgi:hypothetical protein
MTQHDEIQHNNTENMTLSIMAYSMMTLDDDLMLISRAMLNVAYAECRAFSKLR